MNRRLKRQLSNIAIYLIAAAVASLIAYYNTKPEPVDNDQPLNTPAITVIGGYDRDEWHPRWADEDGDCQDNRQETLISYSPVVEFKTNKNCKVASGKWYDPYTDKIYTSPSKLDVDHIVPLSHAHRHGGAAWPVHIKHTFANDPENLIPVYLGANRSKGDKSPNDWMPPNGAYGCAYLGRWITIKEKYSLEYGQAELDFIKDYLRGKCDE